MLGGDIGEMSGPAEIRALSQLGIGAVNEEDKTRNGGVLQLALVTDRIANIRTADEGVVSHEEVKSVAEQMKDLFGRLIQAIVPKLAAL